LPHHKKKKRADKPHLAKSKSVRMVNLYHNKSILRNSTSAVCFTTLHLNLKLLCKVLTWL
jgi:hypothetical protein